jgi:acyl-CoA-dependent ceramide synthase
LVCFCPINKSALLLVTPLTTCAGIAINLVALLSLTHIFFPRARSRTTKFLQLSYYNPETNKYACGTDDLPFVLLWVVIFTGMRVLIMEYFLDPLARLGGIKSRKGLNRFKEQAWLIVYYTASWSLGMVHNRKSISRYAAS